VLARTRSASLRSLPHDGGSDDADLAAGSSTGQPAHGLTPGLDYLLRHEVSVASESMHGIQNPSEVRVDTQPRREREQLCLPTRTLPSLPKAAVVSKVLVRTLSHQPQSSRGRTSQGQTARQTAQAVRQATDRTAAHAHHRRLLHRRPRRALQHRPDRLQAGSEKPLGRRELSRQSTNVGGGSVFSQCSSFAPATSASLASCAA